MKFARTTSEIRAIVAGRRDRGDSVGLVPTMGALHDGHLSHVRRARSDNDLVVVSIFVNPLQFGPGEDLDAYPRDEHGDGQQLAALGADVVFAPPVEEIHPPDRSTTVSVGPLSTILEGAHRPGHFDGVCTVVAKLFNLVTPDRAYFGQKDAQQVAVLQQMVKDLGFPVEIVVGATIREPDGLAMSSRNSYLSPAERVHAAVLFRALQAGRVLAAVGDHAGAEAAMMTLLRSEDGVEPDYATVVDAAGWGPARPGRRVLLVVAARVGRARLIDNLSVEVENS